MGNKNQKTNIIALKDKPGMITSQAITSLFYNYEHPKDLSLQDTSKISSLTFGMYIPI